MVLDGMSARPLEGQLSRRETDELISPVRHFRAVATDELTPYYAWSLRVFEDASGSFSLFNFSRGRGGGEALADSDRRLALARMSAPPRQYQLYREVRSGLPHMRIERATLGARLRALFAPRVRFSGARDFDCRYVVSGEPRKAVAAVVGDELRAHFVNAAPEFDVELEGRWALFARRGALWGDDHAGFFAEVQPVVRWLSDDA